MKLQNNLSIWRSCHVRSHASVKTGLEMFWWEDFPTLSLNSRLEIKFKSDFRSSFFQNQFRTNKQTKANNLTSRRLKTDKSKTCLKSVTISGKNQSFFYHEISGSFDLPYQHIKTSTFSYYNKNLYFPCGRSWAFSASWIRRTCIYGSACKKTT